MKTLPTQERALIKRQSLINAAKREFSNNGFEEATAKTIAAVAAVATGTFYRYFDNKNEILRVIASTRFDELHQRIKRLELKTINQTLSPSLNIEAQFLETRTRPRVTSSARTTARLRPEIKNDYGSRRIRVTQTRSNLR
jgi:AcrR family transcriptional regulator